jgi:hypothetical protein
MRKKLALEKGKRKIFRAVFIRFGKKINYKGYSEETILVKNVFDHIWFSYTKGFKKIALTEGTLLEFDARVKEYTKGYVRKDLKINSRTKDYKLCHPTKIKKID